MTTPNVPHRFEFSVELPGTAEQVWQAIATGPGLTAWYMPSDVEEHVGGAVVIHMGETDAPGRVGEWEPPHRLVIEEPDWAALAGQAGADVTPLVTEYLIEAASGGTCVLRVVSSAFGTGADWEREFFEQAEHYWRPMFEHLRLYLDHFPGQTASLVDIGAAVPSSTSDVLAALRAKLGASAVGDRVDVHGAAGEVAKMSDLGVLVRLTEPRAGYESLYVFPADDDSSYAGVRGYLFGDGAATLAAEREAAWKEWLDQLPAAVG
jgi:uncharacterized protein YndB with AHSA1/START domain